MPRLLVTSSSLDSVTVTVVVVVVEKLSPTLHVPEMGEQSSEASSRNAAFSSMGSLLCSTTGNWVFDSGVKIGTWGLEMGVSKSTSFTDSSAGGGGILHSDSWVALGDLGAWDLSWVCWYFRTFWCCLGVHKQQPIWFEPSNCVVVSWKNGIAWLQLAWFVLKVLMIRET